MLTESEKDWLKRRCMAPTPFCGWCMKYALCCTPQFNRCPIKDSDWQDAVEFAERVAAKLAGRVDACQYVTMPMSKHCMLTGCVACKLRDARLEVEEEMACRK